METPFEDIPGAQRDLRLDRAQAAFDWAAAQGPLGGVILHLRHRAAATRRTALLFLFMLVVAIVIGLFFYLGLPFWQTWADGRREALQETIAGIETRKAELDRDRKELLLGGPLQDGKSTAPGLPALLRDAFVAIPTGMQADLTGAVTHGDRLFVFGTDGTVRRLAADGAGFEEVPTGTVANINGAVTHGARLFIVGNDGNVIASTNVTAEAAAALAADPDEASRATVEAFFDNTLPAHLRDWNPVQTLRDDLRLVASERAGLEEIAKRTNTDLTDLTENPLQYLRDRKALDFKGFLDGCRGEAATADLTTACLAAWQSEHTAGQRTWWETLADQLPPGILLLFLLATLGGLYRYNLRLAGFHESRADALQLLAQGRDATQLRDILAATPGEAVNLATLFLAADKVEMGTIRAKLGQAEIELAKAMHSGE